MASSSSTTRIVPSSATDDLRGGAVGRGRPRQPEDEARAAAGRRLDLERPAVQLGQLAADVQAEAQPAVVAVGAGLVEPLEDPGLVPRRHPGPWSRTATIAAPSAARTSTSIGLP